MTTTVTNSHGADTERRLSRPREPTPIEVKDDLQYQSICQKCERVVLALQAGVIVGHHRLGQLVLEAESMITARRHAYPIVDRLAADIGISSRLLRLCAQFANTVNAGTLEKIYESGMCWDHLRVLMNQGELAALEEWMQQVKKRGLSASSLEEELRGGKLPSRRGSGRKACKPSSALAGLTQLHKQMTSTGNRFDALFSSEFDLADSLKEIPPDELTEEIRDSIDHATSLLQQLAKIAQVHAAALEEASSWMENVFEARRKAELEKLTPDLTGIPQNCFRE